MQRPTKLKIQSLPQYTGLSLACIAVVESEIDATKALAELEVESCLGFDTESKPVFVKGQKSKGPTLIQLATKSKAFLFPTRFPHALSVAGTILSNENIQKVGFGLKPDRKELYSAFNIRLESAKDLSVELKIITDDENPIGARAAVAMLLKSRLSKGAQKSNWANYPLQPNQILYAANDAHSAICVWDKVFCIVDY